MNTQRRHLSSFWYCIPSLHVRLGFFGEVMVPTQVSPAAIPPWTCMLTKTLPILPHIEWHSIETSVSLSLPAVDQAALEEDEDEPGKGASSQLQRKESCNRGAALGQWVSNYLADASFTALVFFFPTQSSLEEAVLCTSCCCLVSPCVSLVSHPDQETWLPVAQSECQQGC